MDEKGVKQQNDEPVTTTPAVESVLRRRKYHIAAAQWLARWAARLAWISAFAALFLLLFPVLSKSWRTAVEAFPVTAWFFHDFSTLGPTARALLGILGGSFLYQALNLKHFRGGGLDVAKEGGIPGVTFMSERGLYPNTRKEESIYWVSFLLELLCYTVGVLYVPLGFMAYFLRMGGLK